MTMYEGLGKKYTNKENYSLCLILWLLVREKVEKNENLGRGPLNQNYRARLCSKKSGGAPKIPNPLKSKVPII